MRFILQLLSRASLEYISRCPDYQDSGFFCAQPLIAVYPSDPNLVGDYLTMKFPKTDPGPFLELVGLSPDLYLCRMVDKCLSGGERKRIELASVPALNPRLAILDEPDSGIDMLSIQDVIHVINAFKKNGTSVLLITHREEIAGIADQASQLCHGKVICSGSPERVAEHYKTQKCMVCAKTECRHA